jgi:hypothetical protein
MAFVNEVVSDADIDKYKLPFAKGGGRYWTRDAERDFYLWGGLSGNPAYGEMTQGHFCLFIDRQLLRISLVPGNGSMKYSETPFIVSWRSIIGIEPTDLGGVGEDRIVSVLKEALHTYGDDGETNQYARDLCVVFEF